MAEVPGRSKRRSPLAAMTSTCSTLASNVVTTGRSRRGAATHSERSQIRPHPNARESPSQPIARSQPATLERESGDGQPSADANDRQPFAGAIQCEPGGNSRPEANDQPKRQLRTLALEEAFNPLARRVKTHRPIAPSTLWKMRTRYVRGARPLHCTIEKRGKRA